MGSYPRMTSTENIMMHWQCAQQREMPIGMMLTEFVEAGVPKCFCCQTDMVLLDKTTLLKDEYFDEPV